MKKLMVALLAVSATFGLVAGPHGHGHGPGGFHGGFRPAPVFHHGGGWHHVPHHGHYHGGWWGRGGCNFWPGFVGGVVGGVVGSAIYNPSPIVMTTPTVVSTPVVAAPVVTQTVVAQPVTTVQNVWVEGRYVDQVQANGTVIRVWQPGHYEQRTVVAQ